MVPQSVIQKRPDVIAGHKMTHIYGSLCYFYCMTHSMELQATYAEPGK